MENLVLVPEREFREFNNWKSKRGANDSGILQAIRNPEQREILQKTMPDMRFLRIQAS